MGLFGLGKKKKAKDSSLGELGSLPKLPELPSLPGTKKLELPQIPKKRQGLSFPGKIPSLNKQVKPIKSSQDIDIPAIRVKPKTNEKKLVIRKPIEIGSKKPVEIEPEERKPMLKKIIRKPMQILSKAKRYEEQIVREEKEEFHELHAHLIGKPVFVEGNIFKEILTDITIINNNLKEGNDSLEKIKSIEKRKTTKFINLKSSILNVQRKLIFIDRLIFK